MHRLHQLELAVCTVLRQVEIIFIIYFYDVDIKLLLINISHYGCFFLQFVHGRDFGWALIILIDFHFVLSFLFIELVFQNRLFVGIELSFAICLSLQFGIRPLVLGDCPVESRHTCRDVADNLVLINKPFFFLFKPRIKFYLRTEVQILIIVLVDLLFLGLSRRCDKFLFLHFIDLIGR